MASDVFQIVTDRLQAWSLHGGSWHGEDVDLAEGPLVGSQVEGSHVMSLGVGSPVVAGPAESPDQVSGLGEGAKQVGVAIPEPVHRLYQRGRIVGLGEGAEEPCGK